jgi:capsid protein
VGNVSTIGEAELQLTAGIGAAAYAAFVRETPGPHADWHEIDAVAQDTWSRIGAAIAKHLI